MRDDNPDLECTAQDLSPFYLAKARENHKAFDKNGGKFTLLEANAEDMSALKDGSFDAVTVCTCSTSCCQRRKRTSLKKCREF